MVVTTTPPALSTANQHATSHGLLGPRSSTRLPGTMPRSRVSTVAIRLAVALQLAVASSVSPSGVSRQGRSGPSSAITAVEQLDGAVEPVGVPQLGQFEDHLRPAVDRREVVAAEGVHVCGRVERGRDRPTSFSKYSQILTTVKRTHVRVSAMVSAWSVETDDSGGRGQKPRALIVTVYGLYAREAGGWMSVASIIRLLAQCAVDEPAVRSAIFRLKRRGLLDAERRDGVAGYALSDEAREILARGRPADLRAAGGATPADGWVLAVFSVPESRAGPAPRAALAAGLAGLRHRVGRRLDRAGAPVRRGQGDAAARRPGRLRRAVPRRPPGLRRHGEPRVAVVGPAPAAAS